MLRHPRLRMSRCGSAAPKFLCGGFGVSGSLLITWGSWTTVPELLHLKIPRTLALDERSLAMHCFLTLLCAQLYVSLDYSGRAALLPCY
jgi:hypothetical protein